MMASPKDSGSSLRDVLDSLVTSDVTGPLDELADVLVMISGKLGRLQRVVDPGAEHAAELAAIDRSFSRSIVLTRAIREQLQARRPRGEYTSASHVAREVVGMLQTVVPENLYLSLHCPPGPAIVAADRVELRRLMGGLLEGAIEASREGGKITLEVSESASRSAGRQERAVHIELRCAGSIDERDARIAALVPVVRALRGTIAFREPLRGGTVISVGLASVL
jgi:signal transduction histidine kinase